MSVQGRVFLSYSSTEREPARRLVVRLREWGLDVWFDLDGLGAFGRAESVILRALDTSMAVVLLLSLRAAQRAWTRSEVTFARRRGLRVFVARLDPCAVPSWAWGTRIVDLFDDWSGGATRLAYELHVHAARRRWVDALKRKSGMRV